MGQMKVVLKPDKSKEAETFGRSQLMRNIKRIAVGTIVVPLVFAIGILGYAGATGTLQELGNGSGVYKIRIGQKNVRIVLPSVVEAKQNYQKAGKVAKAAVEAFDIQNTRVVSALEDAKVVIPPAGMESEADIIGRHDARRGKIYIYRSDDEEEAKRIAKHEILHIYFLKYATNEEEKRISLPAKEIYGWFPEKIGKYMRNEYSKTKSMKSAYQNMQSRFKLNESETSDLKKALKIWLTLYSILQEHPSVSSELSSSAKSEILATFGESKIPEPWLSIYKGILSDNACADYERITGSDIEKAQRIFKNKIDPFL